MKKTWMGVVGGILVVALLVWYWEAPRLSGTTEAKVLRLRRAIALEIQSPDAPAWAGEYCAGPYLGENVDFAIAPRAGFIFERHGSQGLYDRNYGSVAVDNGLLELSFKFDDVQKGPRGIASTLRPVTWGERHYLIAEDELAGFCDAVRNGIEPRKSYLGNFLLRRGDESKPVAGLPDLPEMYRSNL